MAKFNVGDKVRFTGPIEDANLTADKDYAITKLDGVGFRINDDEGYDIYIARYEFKYVEKVSGEQTKNQRITALEKEVKRSNKYSEGLREQLTDALKRIEVLEKAHEPSTIDDVEDKPLSLNQQRAQIIEDANKFVEDCKDFTGLLTNRKGYRAGKFKKVCDAEFVVKPEKRTVVCILKEQIYETIDTKGIAKCNTSDVFNEHIGKAIALGRALGLDVSKFEQAVQPNEVVVGQVVETFLYEGDHHSTFEIGSINHGRRLKLKEKGRTHEPMFIPYEPELGDRIINDTNAEY